MAWNNANLKWQVAKIWYHLRIVQCTHSKPKSNLESCPFLGWFLKWSRAIDSSLQWQHIEADMPSWAWVTITSTLSLPFSCLHQNGCMGSRLLIFTAHYQSSRNFSKYLENFFAMWSYVESDCWGWISQARLDGLFPVSWEPQWQLRLLRKYRRK